MTTRDEAFAAMLDVVGRLAKPRAIFGGWSGPDWHQLVSDAKAAIALAESFMQPTLPAPIARRLAAWLLEVYPTDAPLFAEVQSA